MLLIDSATQHSVKYKTNIYTETHQIQTNILKVLNFSFLSARNVQFKMPNRMKKILTKNKKKNEKRKEKNTHRTTITTKTTTTI